MLDIYLTHEIMNNDTFSSWKIKSYIEIPGTTVKHDEKFRPSEEKFAW